MLVIKKYYISIIRLCLTGIYVLSLNVHLYRAIQSIHMLYSLQSNLMYTGYYNLIITCNHI